MNKNKLAIAAALSVLTLAQPVFALESDRNKPIEIEADQGSLDQKNQVTTFSVMLLLSRVH